MSQSDDGCGCLIVTVGYLAFLAAVIVGATLLVKWAWSW
jgi:hypothetical protein